MFASASMKQVPAEPQDNCVLATRMSFSVVYRDACEVVAFTVREWRPNGRMDETDTSSTVIAVLL